MITLLLILGAIYVAAVRFTLRKQPARTRRLGLITAMIAWLAWVTLMSPYVDAVAEYTGAKFDRAVLVATAGSLLLWIAAPWAAVKIAARASRENDRRLKGRS